MNMKTVKVSGLSGAALNWAVAKCLVVPVIIKDGRVLDAVLLEMQADGSLELDYATDWRQGGRILEWEWLDLTPWPNESREDMRWHCRQHDSSGDCTQYGPTALIAAMRCYVASKLGDTVEIPEELLK